MRRIARSALAIVAIALAALVAVGHATPALGDWRENHKVFRIGFVAASGGAYDSLRLEPFRAYLQSSLAMPVELVPAATYAAMIDAQTTDRVQYAIHTAVSYATASLTCRCIEPLAVPAAFDGARGFFAILLARADGAIRVVADAGGARLAVSAADSLAGRLVPLKYLTHDGIEPASHFSAIVETAGPEAAIAALLTGQADVAVGWSSLTGDAAFGYDFGVLTGMVVDGRLSMNQIRVIWQSPLIPFGPHAVRRELPDDIKAGLVAALSAMAVASPDSLDAVDGSSIGGGGFVAVSDSDYAVIEELLAPAAAEPGG